MSPRPRPPLLTYGAALFIPLAATLLRALLTPLIGSTTIPFITYFPAVLIVAWFGGLRAAVVSIFISALLSDYYFVDPVGTLLIPAPTDRIALVIFAIVGLGIALLADAQGREVARRLKAELAERQQRHQYETTLASIGDAVVSTEASGRVVFANKVAQSLMGCSESEIVGKHLDVIQSSLEATAPNFPLTIAPRQFVTRAAPSAALFSSSEISKSGGAGNEQRVC
jgi:K+-sensing histidine kinase KdpD